MIPVFSYARSFFRGKILFRKTISYGYGFKYPVYLDPSSFGQVYSYDFDLEMVRGYRGKVVEDAGWEFVTVVGKRHATCPS